MSEVQYPESDVAIVGMSGRFPGAPDPDVLWARVAAGDDCLVDLDVDLLIADGVPAHIARSSEYVRRSGVLADVDMFDPGFFSIGRRDAAIMDPQHRHFLECVWEAIESAGHVPERFAGSIGLFAGCGANTYMMNNLLTNAQLVEQVGWFLLRHTANDKDFLATTASYKLDLRGPSVNVQTACSTSLVAVHLAVQSLLGFECDLAVAGGVTIEVPHARGYEYREGEILSPTGVCRAFDAESAGTVLTSGIGIVALRRLQDAVDDGDPILAVIKGSAINNDGARKVGYLAPSVDGHADVVKEALAVAGLEARSIGLLEAHGTGTAVGDPIEVAALTEAFRTSTADSGFCRLVSTKPNIGHLDTAAGTASLIKVVQALRHRTLPPMANYSAPSSLLDIERTPFVLSGEAAPWEATGPRRAGISSLGVGGTNAHVIVEEAPELEVSAPAVPEQVLVISGRDPKSVTDTSDRLAAHLEANPDVNLADVAATLITGRRAMRHRRVVVATDVADAVVQLRGKDRGRTAVEQAGDDAPGVAFMFPGGGSQYVGMAAGLDDRFDVFHATLRQGFDIVRDTTGLDLAPLVAVDGDEIALRNPTASLPAVFVTSVALARQWMAWGITPDALVGHSLGEYVAAHLAGVLSFEDAMSLVMTRSRLMQDMAGDDAAMLIVPLPEADVIPLLGSDLSLAVVNTRDECVVAGRGAAIDALFARLPDDAGAQRIPLAAAAHSYLLDPILPEFLEAVRAVKLSPPTIRYVSNLTGTWITPEQATDPQYWVDHLRHTVRFADCLATVLADGPMVLAELGPGHALSSFARRADGEAAAVIPGLRHPNQVVDDTASSLLSFARVWGAGVDVDLERFAGTGRRRLRLPTYAFQRERFWIEPGAGYGGISPTVTSVATEQIGIAPAGTAASERPRRIDDLDDVFWIPSWQPCDPPISTDRLGAWLVVGDEGDTLVASLVDELVARGAQASAAPGGRAPIFGDALDGVVIVAPLPSVGGNLERSIERWLDHGTAGARALGGAAQPGRLVCVSRDALNAGGSATRAVDALAAGIVSVAPREYPGLTTRLIDVDEAGTAIGDIVDDVLGDGPSVVALRAGARLTPVVERGAVPAVGDTPTFRQGGTYLVTGAFGGVGSVLASHLATQHEANLVLLTTDDVPEAAMRDRWLATHSYDDPTSRRIRKLRELEASGTKIAVVVADVADPAAVHRALDEAERRVGPIDGAIHAAGRLRDRLIEMAEPADHRFVIEAKAGAALTLVDEFERRGVESLVLVSSTSTLLQPDGQTSYVAANSVLDSLAGQHGKLRVSTINFGLWAHVGIASDAGRRAHLSIDEGDPVEHPVLSERSQGRDGTIRLVGRLDSRHHWVVDEHRVPGGNALLPGTGHLELMLAGARFAGHADPQLTGVALLAPLLVPDGRPTTVRVTVTPGDRPTVSIESDGGTARSWIMHSEARIAAATGVAGPFAMDDPMLDGVDPLAGPRRHLALGSHWDSVVDARLGDGVAIADLRLAEPYADEPGPWQAHPALVDVATAVGVALAPPHDENVIYVPIGYERVWMRNPLPGSVRVRARRSAATSPDLLRVDLLALDDAGEAVMDIVGLDLLPVTQHGHLAEVEDDAPTTTGHAAPLIELADELGIRAHEGVEMVERLLAGQHSRLIGSTIDLDDLRRQLDRDAVDEPTTAAAHPTATSGVATAEDAIRMMWVDLLGIDEIADDDDFFDLGGHSLVAIRLMSRIHKELSVRLQLATIFEASTVGALANRVRGDRPDIDQFLADQSSRATDAETGPGSTAVSATASSAAPTEMKQHLVPITSAGTGRPLYIVHGAGGNVLFLWSLARAMAGERPILGFQAHGIEGNDLPDTSIEAMAERYVAELRARTPGPYLLGGFSGGGLVALEMTRQLRDLGETVDLTVLFDSPRAGQAWPGRTLIWRRLAGHILRRGIGPVKPYLRSVAKSFVHRVIPASSHRSVEHEQEEIELGMTDTAAHGFVNLFHYFGATAAKYHMTSYPSDVLLLKADTVWPTQAWDYGWGEHVEGRLEIRVVPGDHNSMFYPENAPAMAEVLSAELKARD